MGSSRTSLADRSAVAHGERGSGLLERQRAEVDHRELDYLSRCRGKSGVDFLVGWKAVMKMSVPEIVLATSQGGSRVGWLSKAEVEVQ